MIASAVLTALSAVLFETPAKAAILAAGAGTFSFAGGALTLKNKDNDNDQFVSLFICLMRIDSAVY